MVNTKAIIIAFLIPFCPDVANDEYAIELLNLYKIMRLSKNKTHFWHKTPYKCHILLLNVCKKMRLSKMKSNFC